MNYQYSFEKLNVWIESKELVKLIYSVTGKFPEEEKFGLISQVRRAAISIASDLAEGTSRTKKKIRRIIQQWHLVLLWKY